MSEVVITGLGACTGFAANAAQLWVGTVQTDKPSAPFGPSPHENVERSTFSAFHFAESAALEALRGAGIWDGQQIHDVDPSRFGCTVSVSKPLLEGDAQVISPETVPQTLCQQFGIQGERRNVIAACATGAYAVALGASWIEQGLCDVVLAGSVEPRIHPLYEAGFRKMGVMSSDNMMRPFDKHRSGFVLSEGAGVVVLESKAHAIKRRATLHAVLSGWGWGSDTHSPVAFNSNGALIAQVIRRALVRAELPPEAIHHVNAHGTATQSNDWIETQALMKAFGSHVDKLMISGTKSSTGHLLGAAGSIELILTVQALQHQFIPPTRNLENPDAALDYTAKQGHSAKFEHALSLSFGFGGPIGALVVSST